MLFRVSLALAITLSAMASEVRLGPEMPLSPETEVVPAAYPQELLGVASSEGEFLALWQTVAGSRLSFHLGQIGSTEPGIRIAGASSAALASSPDGYLVVFVSGSNIYAQHAGTNGQLLDEARVVTSLLASPKVTQLVFGDSAFLLLVTASDGKVHALVLDRDGALLRELPPFSTPIRWAGVQNGQFLVLDSGYTLYRFSSTFGPRASFPLGFSTTTTIRFIAASPNRILVADSQSVRFFDVNGNVIAQTSQPCKRDNYTPSSAWWDGSHFVSTCFDYSSGELSANRYTDNGTLDSGSTLLSSTANGVPLFATNGTHQVLVWNDGHFSADFDIVARAVQGPDSIAPGGELYLVSYSRRAQRAVQIARAGAHRFAVLSDAGLSNFETVIDGATVFHQPTRGIRPTIVAGTHSFLTVWNDWPVDDIELRARRFAFTGEVLDLAPRVLATDVTAYNNTVPGVGFRAPLFVAAAAGDDRHVRARGITEEGALVDVPPSADSGDFILVKPVWSGSELQYATAAYGGGVTFGFPYVLKFAVGRQGATAPVVTSGAYLGSVPPGGMAVGPDRLLCVWVENELRPTRISFALGTLGGRLVRDRTVATFESAFEIEAAWDGSEFVVAWSNGDRIRAMRFSIDGQALDAAPFDISPPGATTDRPSLAVAPTGVDIAYSREDDQAGGVPRAFVRTLDRLPPPVPRRNAVRH